MSSPSDIAKARAEAASIAKAALARESSPILAARLILAMTSRLEVPENDVDLRCLQALDSETDTLPVGGERDKWAERALKETQDEIRRAEAWALEVGAGALRSLVRRWGEAVE